MTAEVKQADRERASRLLDLAPMGGTNRLLNAVAAALAEERERAQAPFLALAEELEAESSAATARCDAMARTDENVRHHAAERRHARVARQAASSIRAAIEALR